MSDYIYHGTTAANAEIAMAEGLHPRGTAAGNWMDDKDGLFVSRPDCVYLTKDAPLYYAAVSTNKPGDTAQQGAVIRMDLDRLDKNALQPDEDYFYLQSPMEIAASLEDKQNYVAACKQKAKDNPQMWVESLKSCGSLAHLGTIPREAIVDVVFINFSFYSLLHAALGSLGEKTDDRSKVLYYHPHLIKWLFGSQLTKLPASIVEELTDLAAFNHELPPAVYRLAKESAIRNMRRRDGLKRRSPIAGK
jgi:hypothetical protein